MQTLQQERAAYALEKIREIARVTQEEKDPRKSQKEFNSYATALPFMIHANGLGSAAAFYRSKKGHHGRLYDLMSRWLTKPGQPYEGSEDLLAGITSRDMNAYFIAQAEAMSLMDWVKKFGRAFLASDGEVSDANEAQC